MNGLRPVCYVAGIVFLPLGAAMAVPTLVDLRAGLDSWSAFAGTGAATVFVGVSLALASRPSGIRLDVRQVFGLTALCWAGAVLLAALPFHLADARVPFVDAVFEAVSGLTTTGSTAFTGLESRSPGTLVWRALLQWLGGMGIVLMALLVLPFLGVGGMQIFQIERSDRAGDRTPGVARLAASVAAIYAVFTLAWAALLRLAGMGWFDAFCHAMTTIATGGYSTRDASIGAFASPAVDAVVVAGMLAASLPFVAYRGLLRGDWRALACDPQVRAFLLLAAAAVAAVAAWLWAAGSAPLEALRRSAFNVVSVMTGTGYSTEDFSLWGGGPVALLFVLMFVGGCTGSTTGGLRVFRLQVMAALAVSQVRKAARPHLVATPRYAGEPLPDSVTASVVVLAALYVATFAAAAGVLAGLGLDRLTSLSAAASAVSIVGPGLGPVVGPGGSYAPLPDAAKWTLAAAMLLGRLEFFTVFALLLPSFWRR